MKDKLRVCSDLNHYSSDCHSLQDFNLVDRKKLYSKMMSLP